MDFDVEEEALLKFLLDSIEDGILIIDDKGKVMYGNLAFLKLVNIDRKQFESQAFPYFIENDRLRKFFISIKDTEDEEKYFEGTHLLIKSIPYIKEDRLLAHVFILKDITEIKDSRTQLKELKTSLDNIEDILEYAYEGFVLVDGEGKVVKMNYEKLMGIKEEDALGKPVQDVIENTRMHIVVKTGKKELRHVQRIQGYDMITNRVPIIRDGKVIGGVGTVLFRDASEVKELARELIQLENKINEYKGELERLQDNRYSFDSIITQDPKMEYLKKLSRKAAESNSTVLILGESGTGKEMFAQAIHKASYRKVESFIPINCAAIPKELLESELFGYEGGAFTGARKGGKPGKFELANGGTIFLDEIGNMSLEMQAKLLRVLEERKFERVGGTKKILLDARIIAATNENIEEAVKKGKFREDLYYRLNVITIDIPPLRDRIGDIPLIAESLLEYLTQELDTQKKSLSPNTLSILKEYHWPGNVRELRNVLERGINLSSGNTILPKHLPERILMNVDRKVDREDEIYPLQEVVAEAEKEAIINAIAKTKGNKTLAAERLGIHRTALYKKINRYGLDL
ncbi:sigma 54-interacting transcriptional regulator [Clostridium sp. Cult3]|uniref:sigma 54-interacting transcriptional regulator n=1 Tax=Clostridium sp. Cult3 TaxID=2079004 RepID=UPI001F0017FB|nr:sigma 54-interacting transcriptional regulator [Clostridium sp. Cult3]MCF6459906.1 sigma-54-dependent Fis family transcriptional regulator [Clostridium sp. Cult3]